MTLELFIAILVIAATATALGVELIKTILDMAGVEYNSVIIAVVVAMIVGIAEVVIYYCTNGLDITWMTILFAVCMGIANTVGATTGYDLVEKFINALFASVEE